MHAASKLVLKRSLLVERLRKQLLSSSVVFLDDGIDGIDGIGVIMLDRSPGVI